MLWLTHKVLISTMMHSFLLQFWFEKKWKRQNSKLCFVCLSTIFMLLRLQRHLLVHLGLIRVASAKNSNRRRILVINIVYRFSLLSKFQNSTSTLLVFQKCCNNHVGRSGTGFSYCKLNRCSCTTIGRELTGKKVSTSYLEFRPIRCLA